MYIKRWQICGVPPLINEIDNPPEDRPARRTVSHTGQSRTHAQWTQGL